MKFEDWLLGELSTYGLPVLVLALFGAGLGLPVPGGLVLVLAGALAAYGRLEPWPALVLGSAAVVAGDCVDYVVARTAGRAAIDRASRRLGLERRLGEAERWAGRRGGAAIFLSRWLVTPLSTAVNLASGLAAYPWPRFLALVAAGELLWVALYMGLGWLFADRVTQVAELLADFSRAAISLVATVVFGWLLLERSARGRLRRGEPSDASATPIDLQPVTLVSAQRPDACPRMERSGQDPLAASIRDGERPRASCPGDSSRGAIDGDPPPAANGVSVPQ